MIKFLLFAILIAICWPIAVVAGLIWLVVAWVSVMANFAAWMVKR